METQDEIIGDLRQGAEYARDGLAVWPVQNDRANEVSIFVAGLSGETAREFHPVSGEAVILRKSLHLKFMVDGDLEGRLATPATLMASEWVIRNLFQGFASVLTGVLTNQRWTRGLFSSTICDSADDGRWRICCGTRRVKALLKMVATPTRSSGASSSTAGRSLNPQHHRASMRPKFHPGHLVRMGKDNTLYAVANGEVRFRGRYVDLIPSDEGVEALRLPVLPPTDSGRSSPALDGWPLHLVGRLDHDAGGPF